MLDHFGSIDALGEPVRERRMQSSRLQIELAAHLDGGAAIASAKGHQALCLGLDVWMHKSTEQDSYERYLWG